MSAAPTVWTATVDDIAPARWLALLASLDAAERAAVARLAFERHRRPRIAAHALKRRMLSALADPNVAPTEWRFETADAGKPRVLGRADLCFSLSHGEGLVVCAFGQGVDVGVDVEPLADAAQLALAAEVFAPAEQRWLEALAPRDRMAGFTRLWTLKEAYVKATGRGITQGLHDFAFAFDPLRIAFADPALGDPHDWCFDQRPVGARHWLALAWRCAAVPCAQPVVVRVEL